MIIEITTPEPNDFTPFTEICELIKKAHAEFSLSHGKAVEIVNTDRNIAIIVKPPHPVNNSE